MPIEKLNNSEAWDQTSNASIIIKKLNEVIDATNKLSEAVEELYKLSQKDFTY